MPGASEKRTKSWDHPKRRSWTPSARRQAQSAQSNALENCPHDRHHAGESKILDYEPISISPRTPAKLRELWDEIELWNSGSLQEVTESAEDMIFSGIVGGNDFGD